MSVLLRDQPSRLGQQFRVYLRRHRTALGLNQSEMARQFGYTQQQWSGFETTALITVDVVEQYAELNGVPVSKLIADIERLKLAG